MFRGVQDVGLRSKQLDELRNGDEAREKLVDHVESYQFGEVVVRYAPPIISLHVLHTTMRIF